MEKRRQILESRRQIELLNEISCKQVNNPAASLHASPKDSDDAQPGGQAGEERAKVSAVGAHEQQQPAGNSGTSGPGQKGAAPAGSQAGRRRANTGGSWSGSSRSSSSSGSSSASSSSSCSSLEARGAKGLGLRGQPADLRTPTGTGSPAAGQQSADTPPQQSRSAQVAGTLEAHVRQPAANGSLGGARQQFVHPSQLMGFVGAPVPKGRRILCLIIRDKMSKLNQNKSSSFFYPIYYLFVQAIVDIEQQAQQRLSSSGHDPAQDRAQDLGQDHAQDHAQERAQEHASPDRSGSLGPGALDDNDPELEQAASSFSASSSLSADLMFIGVNAGSGANSKPEERQSGGPPGAKQPASFRRDSQQSGAAAAAAAASFLPSNTGTSYSDNEIYLDEDDLEGAPAAACQVTPDLKPAASQRPDTLVFPAGGPALGGGNARASPLTGADLSSPSDNEEAPPSQWLPSGGHAAASKWAARQPASLEQVDMFDNEQNPFTGTFGVVLAGRKRKKTKT